MSITKKIEGIEEVFGLHESGIRKIRDLAKQYDKAEIYFHVDLDGVSSAIGIKTYLEKYGIKTVAAHTIQYGDQEFSSPRPRPDTLHVVCDFAHGKVGMHIHTDHHDSQAGVDPSSSTSFVATPSNAAYISQVLSPTDLFPPQDAKIISTVDSADFASQGLQPDDIMRTVFSTDKPKSAKINHRTMGLVANKILLAHKNKKGFLSNLVMNSSASLQSIYVNAIKLAKKAGYRPPEELETDQAHYVKTQKGKMVKDGSIKDISRLKSGQSILINDVILVQYGGGYMGKKNLYDRYTPFKLNPDAVVYTIAWQLGLVQVSYNPFKKIENKTHLGKILLGKVLNKFKSRMQSKKVTLEVIKKTFEEKADAKSFGFTFRDLLSLFEDKVKGLEGRQYWKDMVKDITNKPYKRLSLKQKNILEKVSISLWDLVNAQSGGRESISNMQGLNFYGKGYVDLMKDVQTELVKELSKIYK